MSDHTTTMELLAAERDIERALKVYCRGIDRRDAELVRSVYHDDAIDDHGGAFFGGPDGYIEWVMDHLLHFVSTMHTLHNSLIEVDGDIARVESYCVAHHVRDAEGQLTMDVFGCRYVDRFENRPGVGWRIAHRIVVREWRMRQPMLSEAEQPAGFARSKRDRTDLTYEDQLPTPDVPDAASRWWLSDAS